MSQTWRVCLFAAYECELPFHKVGDTGFSPKAGHKVIKAEVFRVESPQGSGYNEGWREPPPSHAPPCHSDPGFLWPSI